LCNKAWNTKGELSMHSKTHTDEKPYQCELCNQFFKWKNGLVMHMKQQH